MSKNKKVVSKKRKNYYNKSVNALSICIPYFFIPETHNQHIDFEFLLFTEQLVSINQKSMIVNIKKPPYHIIRPSHLYQTFRNSLTNKLIKYYPDELLTLVSYFQKHFPVFIKVDITWGNLNAITEIPLQGDIDAYIKVLIDSIFNALSTLQKQTHHTPKKKIIDDKYINYLTIEKRNKAFKELQVEYPSIKNFKKHLYKKYVFIRGTIYKYKRKVKNE